MCSTTMDMTPLHLPPECYRGTSPRSASTPGPAPDSPSSASGRFSTSPLLSPCFPYHTALQHMSTLGFMGLGVSPSFLTAAAAAAAASNAGHPGTLPAPYGFGAPLPQLLPTMSHPALHTSLANSAIINRLPQPPLLPPAHLPAKTAATGPATRSLSFSVDNILKPDFGPAPVSTSPTVPTEPNRRPTLSPAAALPKHSGKSHSTPKSKSYIPNITENAISSLKRLVEFPKPESSLAKINHLDQNKAPEALSPRLGTSTTTVETPRSDSVDSTKEASKINKPLAEEQQTPVDLSKTEAAGESSDSQAVDELPSDPAKLLEMNKWPAWIFCTRYSDRPSSGRSPRTRRLKRAKKPDEKRPRTAFTAEQLARLKSEFAENRYLTEKRRQDLARELQLHENQIKIWFQNKRAKIKKASGQKNPLALQLMAQGLYNHSTMAMDEDEEAEMEMEMEASSSSSNAC